ncbi:Nop domain-containing protein [Dentipellis sp. KUC8613]|nr:Nop domain-containing protein [Dentipellis sp. KUC8613]
MAPSLTISSALLQSYAPKIYRHYADDLDVQHLVLWALGFIIEFPPGATIPIPSSTADDLTKAQLGLGHSYSRAKVKFNVNRVDNMIIQAIALLDQLDKDVNLFSMRIREWFGYHFPELIRIVPDNYQYARAAQLIGPKETLTEEKLPELAALLDDDATRAQNVLDAAHGSMGSALSEIDMLNIAAFATRVVSIAEYRKSLAAYLSEKMNLVAPSLTALLGERIGARLISHAGSLTNLSKYPASTVQILGAEKALFRALKTKGNIPSTVPVPVM